MSIADLTAPVAPNKDRAFPSIWRLAVKSVNPIVCLNDGSSETPVYCVHPVTGDVVGLRDLARLLGDQRFYGIQVPREKMTRDFAASIEGMATHYVDLIVALQPNGPINLAGWSAGAIIALEMAKQLRQKGRDVPLLIALDGAPCNSGAGLKVWNPLYAIKLVQNMPRWIRDDRHQDWSLRGVVERIRTKLAIRFGLGAPALANIDTFDAETMQRLLDADGWAPGQKAFIHEMYKAMLDYVAEPYEGRVIVYETQTQPLYHLRQIGAVWTKLARDLEIVSLPGNHSGLVHQPTIGRIATHLKARLSSGVPLSAVKPQR